MKEAYARPGDRFEVPLKPFVIDILRPRPEGDLLIEIQTSSFAAMGRKLDNVLAQYELVLVYPVAITTTLHKAGAKPRKSPIRGSIFCVFDELVSVPTLLDNPNFSLEVVLAHVDKYQEHDPKLRRGRGGWRTTDRRLAGIEGAERFDNVADLATLLPSGLGEVFTTADLADRSGVSRDVAQRMAYCFRAAGVFEQLDRTRTGINYRMSPVTH